MPSTCSRMARRNSRSVVAAGNFAAGGLSSKFDAGELSAGGVVQGSLSSAQVADCKSGHTRQGSKTLLRLGTWLGALRGLVHHTCRLRVGRHGLEAVPEVGCVLAGNGGCSVRCILQQ
eukprot:1464332-Rhodomonas_salina.1